MSPSALRQALGFASSWLEFQSGLQHAPGFTVAVYANSGIVFSKAYGLADAEHAAPLTPQHLFNVGSQAKMYTATALMQLVEQGGLSLYDHASAYLPWLAAHKDPAFGRLTIEQLLRHTAGLVRDGAVADYWQLMESFPDKSALRQVVLDAALVQGRHVRPKYSNLAYALLGEIIEVVSGQPCAQYIAQHITGRLGLRDTFVDYSPAQEPRLATNYTIKIDGRRLPVPKAVATAAFAPVTGLYMTAQDACRFMAAHLPGDSRLLQEETKEMLHSSQRHWLPASGRGLQYGLGFMRANQDGRQLIGHSGSFIGSRSCVYADKANRLIVAVAANAKDAPAVELALSLFNILYYFADNAQKPTPPERAVFNIRLMNLWSIVELVATHGNIVSIYPDEWLPFETADELEYIDQNTLRIHQTSSLATPNELIRFSYRNGHVQSVIFGGSTMRPEAAYKRWLANNWPAN